MCNPGKEIGKYGTIKFHGGKVGVTPIPYQPILPLHAFRPKQKGKTKGGGSLYLREKLDYVFSCHMFCGESKRSRLFHSYYPDERSHYSGSDLFSEVFYFSFPAFGVSQFGEKGADALIGSTPTTDVLAVKFKHHVLGDVLAWVEHAMTVPS